MDHLEKEKKMTLIWDSHIKFLPSINFTTTVYKFLPSRMNITIVVFTTAKLYLTFWTKAPTMYPKLFK